MKLITFTAVVNDWRDLDADDDNVNSMLEDVRDLVRFQVSEIADRYGVVLDVNED